MSFELIIDNWMLQDVRSMFQDGLSEEDDHEIVIHKSRNQHLLREVPLAAIQIEALLNLLVSIVLSSTLSIRQHSIMPLSWTQTRVSVFSWSRFLDQTANKGAASIAARAPQPGHR